MYPVKNLAPYSSPLGVNCHVGALATVAKFGKITTSVILRKNNQQRQISERFMSFIPALSNDFWITWFSIRRGWAISHRVWLRLEESFWLAKAISLSIIREDKQVNE